MKEKIRKFILDLGVDDVGFAAIQDYHSPASPPLESIFPEGKSIIVMAFAELDNCESENMQIAFAGRLDQGAFARSSTYQIARFLKRKFRAKVMTVPISYPMEASRGPIAEVSLRHAAVAAGLGNLGLHSLVIHPDLGSKVIFQAVITDLELESDPPVKERLCLDCNACLDNCPAKALGDGKTDALKCLQHSQPYGAMANIGFWHKFIDSTPEEQKKMFLDPQYRQLNQAITLGTQYYCFNCLKSCPVGR